MNKNYNFRGWGKKEKNILTQEMHLKNFYFVFFPSKFENFLLCLFSIKTIIFLKTDKLYSTFFLLKTLALLCQQFCKKKVYQALFFPKKDKVTREKPNLKRFQSQMATSTQNFCFSWVKIDFSWTERSRFFLMAKKWLCRTHKHKNVFNVASVPNVRVLVEKNT